MVKDLKSDRAMPHRRKGQYLLPRIAFDWCLRRNLGSASLAQLAVFSVHIDRGSIPSERTFANWEVRTADCLIAEAQNFHDDSELLFQSSDQPAFCMSRIRCDGTNTVKFDSYHVLELDTTYIIGPSPMEVHHLNFWSEAVHITKDLKNARGTLRMVVRQIESVHSRALELTYSVTKPQQFRCLFVTTDGASEQEGFRDMLKVFHKDRPQAAAFGTACQQHAFSNAAKDCIKALDLVCDQWGLPYRCFSTLVKLVHLWRSARSSFPGKTAPGRPVENRWGTAQSSLTHVLAFPPTEICASAIQVVNGRKSKKQRASKSKSRPDSAATEASVDDFERMLARSSRWDSETLVSIVEKRFWVLQRINHKINTTWNIHHCVLQKYVNESQLGAVLSKADDMYGQFEDMFWRTDWYAVATEGFEDGVPLHLSIDEKDHFIPSRSDINMVSVTLIANQATNYA